MDALLAVIRLRARKKKRIGCYVRIRSEVRPALGTGPRDSTGRSHPLSPLTALE